MSNNYELSQEIMSSSSFKKTGSDTFQKSFSSNNFKSIYNEFNASQVLQNLYLGSEFDINYNEFNDINITHIIYITTKHQNIPNYNNITTSQIIVNIDKTKHYDIDFININKQIYTLLNSDNTVFICCQNGTTLSATIILSFLIQYGHKINEFNKYLSEQTCYKFISYDSALDFLKTKRPNISIDLDSILLLHEFTDNKMQQHKLQLNCNYKI